MSDNKKKQKAANVVKGLGWGVLGGFGAGVIYALLAANYWMGQYAEMSGVVICGLWSLIVAFVAGVLIWLVVVLRASARE